MFEKKKRCLWPKWCHLPKRLHSGAVFQNFKKKGTKTVPKWGPSCGHENGSIVEPFRLHFFSFSAHWFLPVLPVTPTPGHIEFVKMVLRVICKTARELLASLLSRPFDKIKITWGRGRWPRDFRKLGWFSCAKHAEKSVVVWINIKDRILPPCNYCHHPWCVCKTLPMNLYP